MKKGLVLEVNDEYAILADSKGRFVRVKNKGGLQVGSEYEARGIFEIKKQIVIAVASLFLLSCIGGYGYTYASPKAYVALDINPSVKLTTNMYDKVIKIETLNEDAKIITKGLKIKNKDIKEVLKLLVASATENGYIVKDSDNAIMVTATSEDETVTEEILNSAEEAINEELEVKEVENAEIIKENTNQERFDEAERLGISPGKMNLLEKLKVESPDINADEYTDKPVKEIMKKINEEKALKREENKNNKKDEKTEAVTDEKTEQTEESVDETTEELTEEVTEENVATKSKVKVNEDTNSKVKANENSNKTSQVTEKKNSNSIENNKENKDVRVKEDKEVKNTKNKENIKSNR